MAKLNINVKEIPQAESREYSLLEPGWYGAQITSSEMKDTKSGNGSYLSLEFTILDGAMDGCVGRKVWTNLNLDNPNDKAVEIAYADLSAIGHAVGVLNIDDSEMLHGIPLEISVATEAGRDGYADRSVVKGYRAAPGATAPSGGGNGKPATSKAPPWAK